MPRSIKRKGHPLSLRLPETDIAIIDRAATVRGHRAAVSCARPQCGQRRMS